MSEHEEYDYARLTAKREELHNVNERQALQIARLRAALEKANNALIDTAATIRKALANERSI